MFPALIGLLSVKEIEESEFRAGDGNSKLASYRSMYNEVIKYGLRTLNIIGVFKRSCEVGGCSCFCPSSAAESVCNHSSNDFVNHSNCNELSFFFYFF